jgi:hypothetical protein
MEFQLNILTIFADKLTDIYEHQILDACYEARELRPMAGEAISDLICLLFKKRETLDFLRTGDQFHLLNTDDKTLVKVLAPGFRRLHSCLLFQDKNGFVAGRQLT